MTRLALFLSVALAAPLAAQTAPVAATPSNGLVRSIETARTPLVATPTPLGLRTPLAVDMAPTTATLDAATGIATLAARRRGQGELLMIVGGAGIITGALINEDVITVAGAVIGLYGLYLYLR